jgi:hypothetical protein
MVSRPTAAKCLKTEMKDLEEEKISPGAA